MARKFQIKFYKRLQTNYDQNALFLYINLLQFHFTKN